MAKKQIAEVPEHASAPQKATRLIESTVLNPENYIGQYVVVHSAPTAWIGCLVEIERREEAVGCVLADAGLWINGELKEVIRPGLKASKDTDSSHHHVTYVPIVTAIQPAGTPSTINSWKPKYRDRRPGNPQQITLENAAKSASLSTDDMAKAITNAFQAGAKGFDTLCSTINNFAEEVGFPAPAVASILLADVLARTW